MIGQKIKELRKKFNLKQIELAEKVGSQQPQVNRWESGKKLPSLPMLIKISKLFNISLDALIMDDKDLKTLNVKDKTIIEKLKQIENLNDFDKEMIINLINSLSEKNKSGNSNS